MMDCGRAETLSLKGDKMGGKTSCKYYIACGNTDNCKLCDGYEKKERRHSSVSAIVWAQIMEREKKEHEQM